MAESKMPLFSVHFLHFSWILHWNFLHFGLRCKNLFFSLYTKWILDSNVSLAFNPLLASRILLEIMVQIVKPVNIFSCFHVLLMLLVLLLLHVCYSLSLIRSPLHYRTKLNNFIVLYWVVYLSFKKMAGKEIFASRFPFNLNFLQ